MFHVTWPIAGWLSRVTFVRMVSEQSQTGVDTVLKQVEG